MRSARSRQTCSRRDWIRITNDIDKVVKEKYRHAIF